MKIIRLVISALLVTLMLSILSCGTEAGGYLDSLEAAGEYLVTVEHGGERYNAQLSLSQLNGDEPRNAALTLISPEELGGIVLTGDGERYSCRLDGVTVTLKHTDLSPLVGALKLMTPSTVTGATLGGEYNEIVTDMATYYTDKDGNVREIYSDGLYIKLSAVEKSE